VQSLYKGKATPAYLDEVVLSIIKKRSFDGIKLLLEFKEGLFDFTLYNDGRIEFKVSGCNLFGDEEDVLKRNLGILTFIYTSVIPEIKKAYRDDYPSWNKAERDKFIAEKSGELKNSI